MRNLMTRLMARHRAWQFGFLALTAVWLCSCASHRLADGVDVSLANLRFDEATLLETTGTFVIRIQNQMTAPLTVQGGVHKVYLNNTFVGSGVSDQQVEIPRLSEDTITVKIHLRNLTIAKLIRDIVEQKRVGYRLDSTVLGLVGGHAGKMKVTRDGSLDMRDFQPTPSALSLPAPTQP